MSREAVIAEVAEWTRGFYCEGMPFRKNAVASVVLAAEHYRTALASGSVGSLVDHVTASPELSGRLEVIVSADKVERGKPHPEVYLKLAKILGVAPVACVCLGDSQNGLLAGLNTGMKVGAVPDPEFLVDGAVLAKADAVFASLDELTLERLSSLA